MSVDVLNIKRINEEFDRVYQLYSLELYRFCLSKLNYDESFAQDCTQEAFLVLYKRMKQGERFENPRAFLYKTAYNFVKRRYDAIKKEYDNVTYFDEIGDIPDFSIKETTDKVDFELFNKRLNELLTDAEKELYIMRFIEDRRVMDIADLLNITEGNCSMRIMRLRKKIISQLKDFE